MSNLHRIVWIDRQIRLSRYPNRKTIAKKFEISIRQAARDIEYMRDSLLAPIEYSSSKKGYYYKEGTTFALPYSYITKEEHKLLEHLAKQYANYGGSQAAQVAEFFQRLTQGQRQNNQDLDNIPTFTPPGPDQPDEDGVYSSYRSPYLAEVKIEPNEEMTAFQHPIEKVGDYTYQIKFYQSDKIISELLSRFNCFQIISPNWLIAKLKNRLIKIIENH